MFQGNKLRVEILSLMFEPSSHVALEKSVQRVYVEYRLLGVPMETTETPMSLRKPTEGEEIHYNFTRGESGWALCMFASRKFLYEPQISLFVSLSDLCGWLTVSSTKTVSLHHVGRQWPQPGQVVSFYILKTLKTLVYVSQSTKFNCMSVCYMAKD